MERTPLLQVEHVTVSFDGFKALDNVSLLVMPTTVQVVIGPNGAGKSTLMDTIIGRVRPVSGRVMFKGADMTKLPEYEVVRRGICRKFQTPGILSILTAEENLVIAAKRSRGWLSTMRRSIRPAEQARVDEILSIIGLREKRQYALAGHLAHGAKQWLEIGMVVSSSAELLLLDEPAAGMTHQERAKTADLIRNLAQRHAFIVIDHDMDFVEQLAAPVSVLHMGRMLKQGTIEEVRNDPQVRRYILAAPRSPRLLKLERVGAAYGASPILSEIRLEVKSGEAMALLGRNGVGKTTLLRTIAGLHPASTEGKLIFAGEDVTALPAHARARRGIALGASGPRDLSRISQSKRI